MRERDHGVSLDVRQFVRLILYRFGGVAMLAVLIIIIVLVVGGFFVSDAPQHFLDTEHTRP